MRAIVAEEFGGPRETEGCRKGRKASSLIYERENRRTFGYVARGVGRRGIAFICARESPEEPRLVPELKKAFGGPVVANELFTKETGEQVLAKGEADAVAYGTLFTC